MALIPVVGRKSAKMRGLLLGIYFLLCFGAFTTLYPFLIMIGSSITTDYDLAQYKIIPSYLTSNSALEAKYAEDKYNANITTLSDAYQTTYTSLQKVEVPNDPSKVKLVPKWRSFFAALPLMYKQPGFLGASGQYVPSKLLNRYRDWASNKYHGSIDELNKAYTEENTSFLTLFPPYQRPTTRLFLPAQTVKSKDWAEFEKSLPENWMNPVLCDALYRHYLHDEVYQSGKIADLNTVWHTHYTDWTQITLPERLAQAPYPSDWTNFVRTKMPLRFVAIVHIPYPNPHWNTEYIPVLDDNATGDQVRAAANRVSKEDPKIIAVMSIENQWRDQQGQSTPIPLAEDDIEYVDSHASDIRSEFVTRNYRFALDYLALHGRGLLNTVIYCVGAVLVAVIVNPMAAYALSRFKMKQSVALLLFCLATMAFPAEVTMIPNFLLIKQLGLLNTYWALIIPGAGSGFSIFLLKGFFDSLPPELYEAGMLDGASEMTLFYKVTLPLSKPIFAVIALGAFTSMYSSYLFAMTIEQAQGQWPLMVWIYELSAQSAPAYAMMAALMCAALPTLVVFLFAQNVIMKGIILPSYK